MALPKLREGSYFPGWLLGRRRRAEPALTSVVATCYVLGGDRLSQLRVAHNVAGLAALG